MSAENFVVVPEQSEWPHAVLRRYDDFGIEVADLVAPPSRFWADGAIPVRPLYMACEVRRTRAMPSPAAGLMLPAEGESWPAQTRRSLAKLQAWFLLCEDPQKRLEAREVVTLAHQASLVHHVLQEFNLARVLIADEVGLGKTIEAGLILQELLHRQANLRVLYLAPARLVGNVHREFRRLGLDFRCYVAGQENSANLGDTRVIASIHKAVHPSNFDRFADGAGWDVIVVDECHHLSDWAKGGGSPGRKYRLVQKLSGSLRPGGRLILMSGTPHQGHPDRFENLVRLLQGDLETKESVAGRVIYRTKDDVRDWEGRPLFPGRQVNPAMVVDLGPAHRNWLARILDFFEPDAHAGDGTGRRRAAGWRAGQALQWATSSVEAGLGYLIRQGVRLGWDLGRPGMRDAVSAVRPYRGGSREEDVAALFLRIAKEVGVQASEGTVEDIEETEEETVRSGWQANEGLLSELLSEGVALLKSAGRAKWEMLWDRVLAKSDGEKYVLFAQPVETVSSLVSFLEHKTGSRPAVIVGGQTEEERNKEIDAFWRADGPRFLVSSRAGGEGLNLQVARRLVHLDVPWNPMELEQRVGRVHRFMTRRTVIVDTLVVKESREVDAYRVAREKLHDVARTLVPADKFEALFSRVMSLLPPEELQLILANAAHGPLDEVDRSQLNKIVTEGFQRWQDFDRRFSEQHKAIRDLDPGEAGWRDVEGFATERMKAEQVPGFTALRFNFDGNEVVEASESATVLRVGAKLVACGDYGGMPVMGADDARAEKLGLNSPEMAAALREAGLSEKVTGAGIVKWPKGQDLPGGAGGFPFGVLALARQSLQRGQGGAEEGRLELRLFAVPSSGSATELGRGERGAAVRALLAGRQAGNPASHPGLTEALIREETRIANDLRPPTEEERTARVAWAVRPLGAIIVTE